MDETKCRRCDIAMEEGWLLENVTRGARMNVSHILPTVWVSGQPLVYVDRYGQPTGDGYAIAKNQRTILTQSYRCPKCGLLEIFAPSPPSA